MAGGGKKGTNGALKRVAAGDTLEQRGAGGPCPRRKRHPGRYNALEESEAKTMENAGGIHELIAWGAGGADQNGSLAEIQEKMTGDCNISSALRSSVTVGAEYTSDGDMVERGWGSGGSKFLRRGNNA